MNFYQKVKKKFHSSFLTEFLEKKFVTEQTYEENPTLGHRGCRLISVSYPEIYEMQCEAISEALISL